jgi:Undecaprenyl-phosphate glucose phosphotransferase
MGDGVHKFKPAGPANDVSPDRRGAIRDAAALARANLRASARAPGHRIDRELLGRTLGLVDGAVALCMGLAGLFIIAGDVSIAPAGLVLPFIAFIAAAPLLMHASGLHRIPALVSAFERLTTAMMVISLAAATPLALAFLMAPGRIGEVALFSATAFLTLFSIQLFMSVFLVRWKNAGRLAANIVLIGATANARKLVTANEQSGALNVIGVFDDRRARAPSHLAGAPYLGDTDDLFDWPLLPQVDQIVVTVSANAEARVRMLLAKLRALPQPVSLLLDLDGFDPETTSLEAIADTPAARLGGAEGGAGWRLLKRAEDLVLGGGLFLAALPVMAVIAALVKLDSKGPVFFRQRREGFLGRDITVLKFRTMRHEPQPEDGAIRQVERDDPRVTRLGRFLRKTSLDELPQLWNVLTGEMSLVGPRPHAPGMKTGGAETAKLVAEYAHRHRVKPGITGWAQINGSRGPLHSPEAARERIRLDVDYIARASLWLDLWIILRTLPALLGDRKQVR